jgi:hypothetical protein
MVFEWVVALYLLIVVGLVGSLAYMAFTEVRPKRKGGKKPPP